MDVTDSEDDHNNSHNYDMVNAMWTWIALFLVCITSY